MSRRHDIGQPPEEKFGVPGTSYPTPNPQDVLIVEEFPMRNQTYQVLEFGTPHPKTPLALLVGQAPVKGDGTEKTVRRTYATDRIAQEAYNYSIGYSCDGKAFPKIIRKKLVLRSQYTKLAEYAPDPDFAAALLVGEETSRADADLDTLFFWVTYTYETLPGPWVPFTRYDKNLGPVQGQKRHVQNTGQASILSLSGSLDYEAVRTGAAGEESSLVAWEKQEIWTDGTGVGANPAFPINFESDYDVEKGPVQHKYQLTPGPSTNTASLVAGAGNTIVETTYKDFNNFLQERDTATYSLPGPLIQMEVYDDEKGAMIVTTQLVLKASQTPSITLTGSTVTETEYEKVDTLVYRAKTSTFTVPGPLLTRYGYDAETGQEVTTTTQIIAKPTNGSGYGEAAGVTTEYRPQNAVYGLKVITSFATTANFTRQEVRDQPYNYPGLLFQMTGALLEAKNGVATVLLNATRRSPRTRIVSHHVAITYGQQGNLTEPAVFDPVLNNLIYDGAFMRVNERNVLNNAISLSYTTGSGNPIWPLVTESVSFAASTLSATAYFNLIGTYQIVNVIKEKWKYGLWRMSVISVPLR